MSKKLIVNNGQRDRELLVVGTLVIGRDPACDISDADSLLSRRHAEFLLLGDEVVVRDLGSRNGVFVNGRRVAETALQPGDQLQIGNLRLQYVEDSAPLPTDVPGMDSDSPDPWQQALTGDGGGQSFEEIDPESTVLSASMRIPEGFEERRSLPRQDDAPVRAPVAAVAAAAPALVLAPAVAAPAAAPAPRAAIRGAEQSRAGRPASGSWTTFVYAQVGILAVIVLVASMVPLWMQPGGPGRVGALWLAMPVVVALVAAYTTGMVINRRLLRALTTSRADVDR